MPVTEYDQRILDLTKELCLSLGVLNYAPNFVSWEDWDSRSRRPVEFRYDECLVEKYCLTLSAKMKDLLGPEEWRPLIASSLIFTKKLRKRVLQGTATVLGAFLGLAISLQFVLPVLLSEPFTATKNGSTYTGTLGAGIAPLVGFVLATAGTVVLSVKLARRLRTVADKQAADLVSGATFLTTLNKIAGAMRDSGFQENRTFRGPVPLLPDIAKRISRLQTYSQEHHT